MTVKWLVCRKQHKGFEKLLSLGGLWEIVKGKGKAITPAPFWVWEGLATHTPAAAELAAQAADVASAAKYFEVSTTSLDPETTVCLCVQAKNTGSSLHLACMSCALQV